MAYLCDYYHYCQRTETEKVPSWMDLMSQLRLFSVTTAIRLTVCKTLFHEYFLSLSNNQLCISVD